MTTVTEARAWPGGPVVIAPHGLPRPEWLSHRRRGIGGSDVAGIFGLSKYDSPLTIYMDKRGELTDSDSSEAAEWGNLLEPVVAQQWARRAGADTWQPGIVAHPDRPWQVANVDRLYVLDEDKKNHLAGGLDAPVPDGLLEVKTSNQYLSQDWDPDSDRMPDHARLQVQHYLDVTGLDVAHVAALIGGQSLRIFRETYDLELAEMVRAETSRFWHEHVLTGNPPAVDGHPATTDLIGRLYEVDSEAVAVLALNDFRPLLAERIEAKAALDAAKERVDAVNNRIKALLGPCEVGVIDGTPVATWKQVNKKSYVVKEQSYRELRIPKGATDAVLL